jgi:hypothetical protein
MQIHAFDLDGRRLETLKKLTGLAGATNIVAVHQSFLDVDPQDPAYADVCGWMMCAIIPKSRCMWLRDCGISYAWLADIA